MDEFEVSLNLTDIQENELPSISYDHKGVFASDKEQLGGIIGHEGDIMLTIDRPYTPLTRSHAYPAYPKLRESLELHIKEHLDVSIIRKAGIHEEVEINTPVIVAWNNGKCTMVKDFRNFKTYNVPDRYSIPKIQIALIHISHVVYVRTKYFVKTFHQNVVTPRARNYLRIIVHCGVYEYLRMPLGIKNAPSNFRRMMNGIFPEELS
ncbi:hypothetical protein O181_028203 [Austropuccinia psidii MF-1]|uniref:Reverse transcriptase domain-containing protein n=1 Tax=Austropuccinia psidii MF-1 TaxID=1389203 RepID=A0A9Q3CTA3_9BASI|nr:hypothetical protein [Austropuccinia psidii MF-1]